MRWSWAQVRESGWGSSVICSPTIAYRVFATYRQPETATDLLALQNHPKLHCLTLEATEEGEVAQLAAKIQAQAAGLDLVVNCVGVLHQGSLQPEKSLRQIDVDQLMQYFQINSVPGILLAKHLQSLLRQEGRTVFANLSAKIGSIEDNRLGGGMAIGPPKRR